MSGNPYQKRWSTSTSRTPTSTRSSFLTSGVEPSTIGTSWNSVRWTKPSTSTRENLASRFESNPSYSLSPARNRYTTNTETRNAANVASLGPSVLTRASRFDTASPSVRDKYRTEARDLLNKWTSRERGQDQSQPRASSKYLEMYGKKETPSYVSKSLTPTRTVPSRYDSARSMTTTPTPVSSHVLKAERPWRQRMAESSRIRATLGDDYLMRQKAYTESPSFTPSSRFTTATTPSYTRRKEENFMSRSFSPTRSSELTKSTVPKTVSSYGIERKTPSQPPPLPESTKESSAEPRRKMSSKERTARRFSRQGSQQELSSSEDEDRKVRSRSSSKHRKLKKKNSRSDLDKLDTKPTAVTQIPTIMRTPSISKVTEPPEKIDETIKTTPLSPVLSRSSSKNGVMKNQIIRVPSLIEVTGLKKSDSKTDNLLQKEADSRENSQVIDVSYSEEISDLSRLDDESQYSAIAYFNPKKKSRPPVPGTWKIEDGSENISKNKMFAKRGQKAATETTWKDSNREKVNLLCSAAPVKEKPSEPIASSGPTKKKKVVLRKKKLSVSEEKKPVDTPKVIPEENTSMTAEFKKPSSNIKVEKVLELRQKVKLLQKMIGIAKEKGVMFEKHFIKPVVPPNGIRRTLKIGRTSISTKLKCKASSTVSTVFNEKYRLLPCIEKATVLVDTPTIGVNFERLQFICQVVKKAATVASVPERERDNRSVSIASTRAAELLDEMRGKDAAVEWVRPLSDEERDVLILPDSSVLEEYLKRKKNHHRRPYRPSEAKRPASACMANELESSVCPSPCNSTVSEFLPMSSANYFTPRPIPTISTPVKSEDSSTVREEKSESLVVNNFNAKPKGFNRNSELKVIKPIQFDEPKSPFEERLQLQANRIRRGSATSTLSGVSDIENQEIPSRKGSYAEGMSTLSQQFTDAALAQTAHVGRYAAHIPVRGEGSGRNSVISLDSVNSGVLETASKKLDSVIDQARQRHHHHKSKFKEAIDYLDQIFEDLKKEYDVNDDKNNNATENRPVQPPVPKERNASLQKVAIVQPAQAEKKTTIVKPTIVRKTSTGNTNSLPNRAIAHREKPQVVKENSPVEVMIKMKKQISEEDENIAETFQLPKRTDKRDFTRRWLEDDLSSLARAPPPNLIPAESMDYDEHSLGSCSAEVAAINTKEKKKSSVPTYAPEPTIYTHQPMQRSSSQEKYNTLRSEGAGPSPSAFQNFGSLSNRNAPQRTSLRSIQGHVPSRTNSTKSLSQNIPQVRQDAVLAIDQLVAELDLNTEQYVPQTEKRRSFPTAIVRNDFEQPVKQRAEIQHGPTKIRAAQGFFGQPSSHSRSMERSPRYPSEKERTPRRNEHQQSLEEATEALLATMQPAHHSHVHKQNSTNSQHGQHAFETINQEKINPSRVEAMQNMFERGTASTAWKRQNVYKSPSKEEETYYEINEFSEKPYKRVSPPREVHMSSSTQMRPARPFPPSRQQDTVPTVPQSQPPQRPQGSAGSSNGYYSSNSIGPSYPVQRSARSSSTRGPSVQPAQNSVEDEDDGFYDNIGIFDDRRFSLASEVDTSSICSRQLPPHHSGTGPRRSSQNRIGSFFRKIGGSASRPPGSAASLLSLNRVSNETVVKPTPGLMKSNSLSTEPWKRQILDNGASSMPASGNKGGLGARLKNTLFGSKKRLN